MAIKIEISGFDKDFLPVFESLAKSSHIFILVFLKNRFYYSLIFYIVF
ncbi:hypothetical protein [Campylobacter jejuni]|nr:hypothetical protein [Campylobacter jejuni]